MSRLEEIQARQDGITKWWLTRHPDHAFTETRQELGKLLDALRAVDAVCVAFDEGVGIGTGHANEQSQQTKMVRAAIQEALA
ncbi:hypothetical protein [Arthrobacter glacialis]|uniref:hypothetical protein n=1 Tax=Arthrobacter glacialis TaxID=1664 RepID=UPI000CD445AA|nr:hypothetical protein [Arthrobacter glacialis]POH58902.1 hypothetical protein CVS28_09340 [Arthrobacter glacialis]